MAEGARVLVVGSFNMDMVVQTDRAPRAGETVLGGQFFTAHGGKGANQAVAAARMGAGVAFAGRIGRDAFGDAALTSLAAEGIDTRHLARDPSLPTGVAMIILEAGGENRIIVAPGANSAVSADDASAWGDAIAASRVVLAQLETPIPAVEAVLAAAQSAGRVTILNPAPAPRELPDSILACVSILTPNETETEALTGISVTDPASAERAAAVLHARGVETVVITLGDKGAYISSKELRESVPTRAATAVVDTTGAGDTFSGALAAFLAEGKGLVEAVRLACEAATISVTRLGAQPSIPRRGELGEIKAPA